MKEKEDPGCWKRGAGFRQGEAELGEWEGKSTGGARPKPATDKAPFREMGKEGGQGKGRES